MFLAFIFTVVSIAPASAQEMPVPLWQSKVIAEIAQIYQPFAITQGMTVNFVEDTENTMIVASAHNDDGVNAKVVLAKGLLNAPRLNEDSLRMTICHELGHIFGGAPRRNVPGEWEGLTAEDGLSIMTSEGQSDYYASMICFPRVVRGQDHEVVLEKRPPTEIVKSLCGKNLTADNSLICQRSMMASADFLNTVIEFKISIATPAKEVATKLDRNSYPSRQCRLDILVAGSLCQSDRELQLDRNDPEKSGCPSTEGQRPACWYPAPNL